MWAYDGVSGLHPFLDVVSLLYVLLLLFLGEFLLGCCRFLEVHAHVVGHILLDDGIEVFSSEANDVGVANLADDFLYFGKVDVGHGLNLVVLDHDFELLFLRKAMHDGDLSLSTTQILQSQLFAVTYCSRR